MSNLNPVKYFSILSFNPFSVCGVRGREQKIVGGSETLPNELPWVAGLFKQNKLYCGASIVTNKFLLTAAHCVSNFEPREIRVRFLKIGVLAEVTSHKK
jgi:secreted trypsin-like serine protease